jgi:hypothetical protein
MKVPMTIATPGKDSEKIRPAELGNRVFEFCHFRMAFTNINGEINLKKRVNTANGHNNSGDVEA